MIVKVIGGTKAGRDVKLVVVAISTFTSSVKDFCGNDTTHRKNRGSSTSPLGSPHLSPQARPSSKVHHQRRSPTSRAVASSIPCTRPTQELVIGGIVFRNTFLEVSTIERKWHRRGQG